MGTMIAQLVPRAPRDHLPSRRGREGLAGSTGGEGEEEQWGNVAKIMGLVVTGTERQGKLVQGGETEAKGQKGKVQLRRESLVWTRASSFFLELFGRTLH